MDFGKFDMILLTTMSLSIVIMSIAFPALGMADEDAVNATDIPEFNVSSNQWDIAGDFPEKPSTPTGGILEYDGTLANPNGIEGISLETIDPRKGPNDDSLTVEVQNSSLGFRVAVTSFNGSTNVATTDAYTITGEGQMILHENTSWNIRFDVDSIQNYLQPNMTAAVEFKILDSPSDASSWGIFWPIGEVVGMLAYLGDIIFWGVGFIFEVSLTIVQTLVSVMVYTVGMAQWLTSTYTAIISGAGSWAGVFLAIPGVLLFLEFAKLAMLGIKLLPTT